MGNPQNSKAKESPHRGMRHDVGPNGRHLFTREMGGAHFITEVTPGQDPVCRAYVNRDEFVRAFNQVADGTSLRVLPNDRVAPPPSLDEEQVRLMIEEEVGRRLPQVHTLGKLLDMVADSISAGNGIRTVYDKDAGRITISAE